MPLDSGKTVLFAAKTGTSQFALVTSKFNGTLFFYLHRSSSALFYRPNYAATNSRTRFLNIEHSNTKISSSAVARNLVLLLLRLL